MGADMSMISAQCDELRETASQLENLYNLDRYARDVYLAADTIWELRCKMADMVDQREEVERLKAESEMQASINATADENAKLRVDRDEWHRVALSKQSIIDRMRDARAENAKLRKLVRKWYPHMLKRVGRDALEQWGQMDVVKELGVENAYE